MNLEVCIDSNKKIEKSEILKIKPFFAFPLTFYPEHIKSYIASMERLLETIIHIKNREIDDIKGFLLKLNQNMPIITHSELKDPPFCFTLSILCFADFIQGIDKFILDMMNKWLTPGKQLAINAHRSLQFHFIKHPIKECYLSEYFININNEKELNLIKRNFSTFINELKLIILSAQHARHILSINKLSEKQKSIMIEENISSLFDKKTNKNNTIDQMKDFIFKISHEKKLSDIKENIASLMHRKPNTFD